MVTPFSWLAARYTLGPRALRWGTTAAFVVSLFIVFSGGVVRVTGSGLGCPTWPACEPGSLTTTPELGIHGLIEFGNRALTGLLILAVGWAIVAARLQRQRNRTLTRLAWSQFWLVVGNSVAGGISVLTGLNPFVVSMHFLLAIALLTTTTLTWHRARQSLGASVTPRADGARSAVSAVASRLSWLLVGVTFVLVAVGTLVTGSGHHSGDSSAVPRMNFVWQQIVIVHGVLGFVLLAATVALLLALRSRENSGLAQRRVWFFIVAILGQSLIGTVQAVTDSPAALVALHVVGSACVWVGAVRVLLDVNPALWATFHAANAAETGALDGVAAVSFVAQGKP